MLVIHIPPVRGPHPIRVRASGQKKEIQGGLGRDGGEKKSAGAEVLVAGVMQTSDPRRPALGSKMTVT